MTESNKINPNDLENVAGGRSDGPQASPERRGDSTTDPNITRTQLKKEQTASISAGRGESSRANIDAPGRTAPIPPHIDRNPPESKLSDK